MRPPRVRAAGGEDGKVCLRRRQGGAFRDRLTLTFPDRIVAVAFLPGEKGELAVLVHNERALRLWHGDNMAGYLLYEEGRDRSKTVRLGLMGSQQTAAAK